MRHLRRLLAVGTAAGAITFSLVAPSTSRAVAADTSSMFGCTSSGGVWVVVQDPAAHLDQQGCATSPSSGLDALQQIGVQVTRDSKGMVAQLAGEPDPVPASFDGNYWQYWQTTPASETTLKPWAYATAGADVSQPAPGSVEGWYYGSSQESQLPTTLTSPAPTMSASAVPASVEPTVGDSAGSAAETGTGGSSSGVIGWTVAGVVIVGAAGTLGWRQWRQRRG